MSTSRLGAIKELLLQTNATGVSAAQIEKTIRVFDRHEVQGEMSLRDYFAAHASETDVDSYRSYWGKNNAPRERTRQEAKFAYADAMIAARSKQEGAR